MFLKECKAISKSIIYFAFLTVVALFYVTQLGNYAGNDIRQYTTRAVVSGNPLSGNPLIAPVPGQDHYGYKNAEIPEQVMSNAIAHLVVEYVENGFANYATGFYRSIKLSDVQLGEIAKLVTEMTGLSIQEVLTLRNEKVIADGNAAFMQGIQVDYRDVIPIQVNYDAFKEHMKHLDKMIGGGSYYDPLNLKQYGYAAVSYDEKLAEYNDMLQQDKITGAYARLFCDYMGITIALFAVFVPVSFLLRDKRAKMNELIYARGKSTAKIVLVRYLALVCMSTLPFLLLSLIPTVQLSVFGLQNNIKVNYWAFMQYIATWLLPTILTTTSVAYFFTTLTDTPIAIILQLVWSLFGIFASTTAIEGGRYGIEITIRHNSLFNLQLMQENIHALIVNRLAYTVISFALIAASTYLYHLKRRGRLHVLGFKKAIRNR